MSKYEILGPKEGEFRSYNTINYCEKILDGIVQEDVDAYHVGLGKLYLWLRNAIDGRKLDITRRKALARQAKQNRENKIKEHEDRTIKRQDYLTAEEEKFKDQNRETIEAYEKQQEEIKRKAEQEYGDEADDGDEEK